MQEPLISIIIPVYNTEKYLEKCLDSVLNQTYKNLEIICINDGSTDSSPDILQKYSEKDDRVKIINKKNSGVSHSRNVGIEQANGEWITFIDSDDYIENSLYEKFVTTLNNTKPFDIYVFNGVIVNENENPYNEKLQKFFYMSNWNYHENNLYVFKDCRNPFYGNLSVWNKIFKRQFLEEHNIRFKENTIFEDQLFVIDTTIKADMFYLNKEILYFYVQHPSSTMHTLKENVFQIFEIMNDIKTLLFEHNLYEYEKYVFLQHKFNVYNYLLFRTEKSLRERFYGRAQRNLHNESNNNFDMDKVKQIAKSDIFFNYTSMPYAEYVKHYSK